MDVNGINAVMGRINAIQQRIDAIDTFSPTLRSGLIRDRKAAGRAPDFNRCLMKP